MTGQLVQRVGHHLSPARTWRTRSQPRGPTSWEATPEALSAFSWQRSAGIRTGNWKAVWNNNLGNW